MLVGNTRPDGLIISVGNAAHDPMMMLAHGIIQPSMRDGPERSGSSQQHLPADRPTSSNLVAFT